MMHFKVNLILIFTFLTILTSQANTIVGKVTDKNNKPVPFLTVYIQGTTNGTNTNQNGEYFLTVEAGEHQVVFRHIGYKTEIREVNVREDELELNVQMGIEAMQLAEIQISSKDKDPAYAIIRAAQKKRKFYLNQIKKYDCDVYIKGMNYLEDVPEKILGQEIHIEGLDESRSGIVYLSESVSKLYYKEPKYKEVMISSKVSGDNQSFSWNSALDFAFNLYENSISMGGLSERDFISPIATTALFYYKYKYIGEFQENGVTVNKIKVIPRAKGAPLFKGYIYIQEDTWRVHSTELYVTKDAKIEFLDTLKINQVYVPVTQDVWACQTQAFEFRFDIKFVKIKGYGSFLGSYSNYNLEPKFYFPKVDENQTTQESRKEFTKNALAKTKTKIQKEVKQETKQEEAKRTKKFFNAEQIRVLPKSNLKTDEYWAKIRPIPLTLTEKTDYHKKDSIKQLVESKPYKDSIDAKTNKFKVMNVLFGYSHQNSFKHSSWSISAPINGIQFNTVEGWLGNVGFNYTTYNDSLYTRSKIWTNLRYGFSSKQPYFKLGASHRFNATNRLYISLEGGKYVSQFNNENPISSLINGIYTLFREENYMKLYEKTYIQAKLSRELINGIRLYTDVEYSQRRALQNAKNLPEPFKNREEVEYTSNNPINSADTRPFFEKYNSLLLTASLEFRIGQKYQTRPNLKVNMGSKYPVLAIYYQKGIPNIGKSNTDFDFLKLIAKDEVNIGIFGKANYYLGYGMFLRNKNLPFIDYKHFNTSQTIFASVGLRSFYLLPYYERSTNENFFEGHFEHHFNGFVFNKIPLLKKLGWQTVFGSHLLYTKENKEYLEVTAGIEHIFKVGRIDFITAFQANEKTKTGFRISFGF
jgi:hypothetical protein